MTQQDQTSGAPGTARSGRPGAEGAGLVARAVSKRFGSVIANDAVDLTVTPGRVHGLLGENGAGKSTLVSMLDGRVEPDEGSVHLDGEPAAAVSSMRRIATVHQTLALVPSMTGLENIALGLGEAASRGLRTRIAEVEERFSIAGELDAPVSELELPQRQRIALLEALSQEPYILILDEPTTFLPPSDVQPFLRRVRELAEAGVGVLLITHHLEEARSVADEMTILRRGRVVDRFSKDQVPANAALARAIVGESVVEPSRERRATDEAVLVCRRLSVTEASVRALADVDLELRRGEIVGIAGVDGNGQLELLEVISGLRAPSGGSVEFEGEDISHLSYRERAQRGLRFVSGERLRDGIIPTFSIGEHFWVEPAPHADLDVDSVLEKYDVRPPRVGLRADRLSGGNQQKMIMGRALERGPKVLILAYPTQGLDVLATTQIHRFLLEQADQGASIVVASSDLEELLALSDRIFVLSRGAIAGVQESGRFEQDQLAAWFTGGERRQVEA